MRREVADLVFTALLLAVVAWTTFEARQWDPRAKLFPWVVGLPVLVMLGLHLAGTIRSLLATPRQGHTAETSESDMDPRLARRRTLVVVSWLAGFAVAIWAIGFALGGTLATLAYLKLAARERWPISLAITGSTAVFFWAMIRLLHVPFPRGFLIDQLPV